MGHIIIIIITTVERPHDNRYNPPPPQDGYGCPTRCVFFHRSYPESLCCFLDLRAVLMFYRIDSRNNPALCWVRIGRVGRRWLLPLWYAVIVARICSIDIIMAPIDRCTSWRQIIMIEFVDQNTSLAPMPSTTLEIVQLRTQNTMTLRRKNLVMVDVFDFVRTHCTRKESRGNTCVIACDWYCTW